jgi:hypothetical protein
MQLEIERLLLAISIDELSATTYTLGFANSVRF